MTKEEMFNNIWKNLSVEFENNPDKKLSAKELFDVLNSLAPSIARILPIATQWVRRQVQLQEMNRGSISLADILHLNSLCQLELTIRKTEFYTHICRFFISSTEE